MRRFYHLSLALLIVVFTQAPTLFANSPLKPHLLNPEAYSETYTAVLELEGGLHIQVQFAVTNIGLGDQHSMCRVLFIDEEEAWNESPVFGRDEWSFQPPGRLDIGPCSISAEKERTTIRAQVTKGSIEVALSEPIKPTQPPGHLIKANDGFFDNEIFINRAGADVHLHLQDQPNRRLKGYGCMYHFWVTAWPAGLARKWVRVYGLWQNQSILVMSHFPPGKEPARGSIWHPGASTPIALDSLLMEGGKDSYHIISISQGEKEYSLELLKLLYRHAPLEEIGFLGRIIGLFMGNWVTRTYRAQLEMPGNGNIYIPLIVEITEEE